MSTAPGVESACAVDCPRCGLLVFTDPAVAARVRVAHQRCPDLVCLTA